MEIKPNDLAKRFYKSLTQVEKTVNIFDGKENNSEKMKPYSKNKKEIR